MVFPKAVLAVVLVMAAASTARAAPGDPGVAVAGYKPTEDVTEQARIDLDVKAIVAAGTNWAAARRVYTNGGASRDEDGGIRTLQGFSTLYASPGPFRKELTAAAGKAFWGDWDYANKHVLAALNGVNSGKYGRYGSGALAKTNAARAQVVKKVIRFTIIPQYVQHELAKAIRDAKAKDFETASEHWDEGWVFYAGSTEKGDGSGNSAYILAEKRAKNFGTLMGGRSRVNRKLLAAWKAGQKQVKRPGSTDPLARTIRCIRGLMAVPAIQGCLRYAYKVSDPKVSPASTLAKESAEAWAFCAAALPGLAKVNAGAARRVRAQTFLAGSKRPNWPVVRQAFGAANLNKMGIRCADVGALNTEYPASKHPVCRDGTVYNEDQGVNYC